jgi:glucan-binding YG repeat protein
MAMGDRLREEMRHEIEHVMTVLNTKLDAIVREMDRSELARKDAVETAASSTAAALNKAEGTLQMALAGAKQEVQHSLTEVEKRVNERLTETENKITDLSDEKFTSIAKQFIERDTRTEQAAVATKIAVDAALQAQKEAAGAQNESNAAAITKSEAATIKQIDGITALLNSGLAALNDKIIDLRSRIDRGEGGQNGERMVRTDQREVRADHRGDISLIVAAAAVLVALGLHFIK